MATLLTSDLLLKIGLYVGAPLIAALMIWFNGYQKGQAKEEARQREAKEAQERAIKGAQARNERLDWERDQRINEISQMKSTTDLLQAWNQRWGGGKSGDESNSKDPGNPKP